MARSQPVKQSVGREARRDFFIQIPACLEYLPDIDPYAWRLYVHYLRICGESDHCYEYTNTTSRLCKMSERTIRYRRQLLADLNLIAFWHEGEKGDERVHVIIRDVWHINAQFLRMITGSSSAGEWVEEWIRSELSKLPSLGENTLSEGKHPPAPNADPPAPNADPPAPNADPPAPNADPPAPNADRERSLRKIPYTDRAFESERARAATPTPTPTPAMSPVSVNSRPPRLSNDSADMPDSSKTPPPGLPAPPLPTERTLIDGRKWRKGGSFIQAGKGETPVEIYYEAFSISDKDTRLTEPDEDDLTGCGDLVRFREVIATYRRCNFKTKRNIQLILEWYRDGIPEKYKRKDQPNEHHTATPATEPTGRYAKLKAGKTGI